MRDCSTNLVVFDHVFFDLKINKNVVCKIIGVFQHDCTVNKPEGEGPEGVLSMDQPPVLVDQAR